MQQAFFIPGPLPAMNDFISTGSRFLYNDAKAQWEDTIGWQIKRYRLKPMKRVYIRWTWQEKDRRRDPDNFVAIGKKFILDALVRLDILPDDGWDEIDGWDDRWVVVKDAPGVLVQLEER